MSEITEPNKSSSRIYALDLLRGLFIVIIITDHIWRWPNIFQFISGRGELWVSAAEGFVIISGLLVGYIHGFKKLKLPLKDISKKVLTRAFMLYAWSVITTLLLVAATWHFNSKGPAAHIEIPEGDWQAAITQTLTMKYSHVLTHFLHLYAIFLFISPLALWLFRKNKAWLVALNSLVVYIYGFYSGHEWMQWQIIFFIPATFGFYMEKIISWIRSLKQPAKAIVKYTPSAIFIVTALVSMYLAFQMEPGQYRNSIFSRDPALTIGDVILSLIWFSGLLSIFQRFTSRIKNTIGWLLMPFGERSLTAYISHAIFVVLIQWFIVSTAGKLWVNTIITALTILLTLLVLKIPGINKVIPR